MGKFNNVSYKVSWLAVLLLFLVVTAFQENVLGYLLGISFFVFALFRPKYAILLLFMYYPIRPFIIEYVSSLRYVGDLIIFGALLRIIWNGRTNVKSLINFKTFEYGYFAFIIIGATSAILNDISVTMVIIQIRAFILLYLIYYIVSRLKITKADIKHLLWITIWTVIVIIIQAIFEKLSVRTLFLPESWQTMPLSSKNRVRIYGMLGNPNTLSIYLSFVFLFFFYAKKYIAGANSKLLSFLNLSVLGIIILTYSRGTWIGIIVMLAVYIVLTRKLYILKDVLKTVLVATLLFIMPVVSITSYIESSEEGTEKVKEIQKYDQEGKSGFVDRVGKTFSDDTITSSKKSGRLYIVEKGYEIFKDFPIIGTGFSTFGDSASLRRVSPMYEEYNIGYQFYSDNQYIQVIVQTGLLGVIAFAVFLLHMLFIYWKRRKESFSALMVSVLLSAFVMGLVYNLWEADIFGLCFFALLAISVRSKEELMSLHASLVMKYD
ncbi:O-antigen polymerase [Lottiidibacillus patelloidae]|uniref:O-antigen polymerase n=1 Tax=Lottiidibacillus patelloidae TaxID=2670334 RepID=A0A263BSF9_9BACI|nr:O-antigen ligase family protein [Lottiidibacillus patelloidae]OZM56650.1 O-antigen polymerase [Lottiidibacillus patelloidae]